jgi:hypothetical protein
MSVKVLLLLDNIGEERFHHLAMVDSLRGCADVLGGVRIQSQRKGRITRVIKKYGVVAPYYLAAAFVGKLRNRRVDGVRKQAFGDHKKSLKNLKITEFSSQEDSCLVEYIRETSPDVLFNLSLPYVQPQLLDLCPAGVWGFHHGVLPHIRGLASPFWAAYHCRPDWYGITLQRLSPKLDGGRILASRKPMPPPNVTLADLYITLDKAALECIPEAISRLREGVLSEDNGHGGSVYKSMPGLIQQLLFGARLKRFNRIMKAMRDGYEG